MTVLDLGVWDEGLVGGQVPALELTLVNVACLRDSADDFSHAPLVAGIGRADKVIVRDLEGFPE